jgi:lysophospholipase L1-like esterase
MAPPALPSRAALLALALAGLIAGLAVAEIALRLLPERPHRYMTSDPVLHHRLLPNASTRVRGVELTTNSLGLRDREIAPRKPPGVFRVLMLGDSFTEGGGLTLEQTVAKQVEAMLGAAPCRQRVEVINGGVSSYSPILEYLFLQRVGLALDPDLVVLNFDMTDVHDDVVRTGLAQLDPAGLPLAVPSDRRRETALLLPPLSKPALLRFLDPVEAFLNRSKLYQSVRTAAWGQALLGDLSLTPERTEALGLVGDPRYDIEGVTRSGDFPGQAAAWRLTGRYISGVHALARAQGRAFALVVYPHAQQVSAEASPGGRRRHGLGPGLFDSERPFQILAGLGRREGFPVIDLLHRFREGEAREGPLFRIDDIHHTPAGARVFAQGVAAGLREHGLVPCGPASPSAPVGRIRRSGARSTEEVVLRGTRWSR